MTSVFSSVRYLPVPARSYDARHRAYDARHRASKTSRPSRLIAGLALPTAAAAALTFTATGAAVATSTQAVTGSRNVAATAGPSAALATLGDSRSQAIQDNAKARVYAAASAARSTERKDLAARKARILAAQRVEESQSWQLPLKNVVHTSDFGWRWGRLHAGEDFAAPIGTELVSMSTGTVIFAGEQSGYGTLVKIRYWDNTVTFYAHMSSTSVREGEVVEPGEVVGLSGNSGHSTGPHLHLEVHPDGGEAIDPAVWLSNHRLDY
ncbi:MAG: M23 family metallopeptidase [Dermatophilaceae bacterium]